MTNVNSGKPKSWPKRLMWFGIIFLLLLLVLYFVATSAAFLRSVILPRVGKSMNSTRFLFSFAQSSAWYSGL